MSLCSDIYLTRCCKRQAGETSVEIKRQKKELVSLTKQQLVGRMRLFKAVPGRYFLLIEMEEERTKQTVADAC